MIHSIQVNLSPEELTSKIENSFRKIIAEYLQGPTQEKGPEIMNAIQTASLLDVSISTLYSYVHYKKIPFLKKFGKLYFKRSEIMEWLASAHYMTSDEISRTTFNSLQK